MGAASKNFTAEVAACTALGEADLYVWTVLIAQQLATLRNFLGTLTYYLVQEKLYVSTRHRPSNCSESRNVIRALFVFTLLLAALPAHRAPAQEGSPQGSTARSPQVDHRGMAGMDVGDEHASEKAAVGDMTPGHHDAHSAHMTMTAMRTQTPEDVQRAKEVVAQLRAGIEKYRDYHVALNDGFKIFLPSVPQAEYHFTNYRNGFLEGFTFDPARPTSLLYRKTSSGYELAGAMYTMPKRATEDQLDARVPLSVAMWHLHTNLCMPTHAQVRNADWSKFGLKGSIAT